MIKVSVIIPVYNGEKHLRECIDSLLAQTQTECEFIFIDDGSHDKSASIIESYQAKDKRIILIRQENQGVSAARNKGLAIAAGDYIGFVDGDDSVASDMYQILYETAVNHDADIVISKFIVEQDGTVLESKSFFPTGQLFGEDYIQTNIYPFFIQQDDLNSVCIKLFKRSLLTENKITFPHGMAHGEDAMFSLTALVKAKNLVFEDYSGYFYREVSGSASRNIASKDYFQKALEIYKYDYQANFDLKMTSETIHKLQGIRFINTLVSLIHIYFKPNSELKFLKRYALVRNIIRHKEVQDALQENWNSINKGKSKYQGFILQLMKKKYMLGLVAATQFSNYRNK